MRLGFFLGDVERLLTGRAAVMPMASWMWGRGWPADSVVDGGGNWIMPVGPWPFSFYPSCPQRRANVQVKNSQQTLFSRLNLSDCVEQ